MSLCYASDSDAIALPPTSACAGRGVLLIARCIQLDRARLTEDTNGVQFENNRGRMHVPVARLCALLLRAGTTVTHRAAHTVGRARPIGDDVVRKGSADHIGGAHHCLCLILLS